MIHDSKPWKRDLRRDAAVLTNQLKQVPARWTDRVLYELERRWFLTAFAARKLMDSAKVCDDIADCAVKVAVVPALSDYITTFNRSRIDEHYDLNAATTFSLSLREVCNQIIHSHVFAHFMSRDRRPMGIFFSSERERHQQAFYLTTREWTRALRCVSDDDPNSYERRTDPKTGDVAFAAKCWAEAEARVPLHGGPAGQSKVAARVAAKRRDSPASLLDF